MIGSFAFAAPFTLAALALLPALYWLLRVTPPRPKRIDFPPLRIILDLLPEKETVARTPWWLLALRLTVAAALILALAGPVWNARRASTAADGALLLVIDNGWPSAPDWTQRLAAAEQALVNAQARGRAVALVATADWAQEPALGDAAQALEKLRGLRPQPHMPERGAHAGRIATFLDRHPGMNVAWIADGVTLQAPDPLLRALSERSGGRTIEISRNPRASQRGLAGVENGATGLSVRTLRAAADGSSDALLRALDRKGLPLGEGRATFDGDALEATAAIDLPLELRNQVARVEILDEASAGAVSLLDGSQRRRRVAVVTGATTDTAQPLLAATYYLSRALAPFAEVREGRGSPADAIATLLPEKPSVVVLADVGALTGDALRQMQKFVEDGGVLIRFAGSRLAAANDELVPVRLRRGGRTLGGTLSWETPKTLAPFGDASPFKALKPPSEVSITRQILAEPDLSLVGKTWAALSDGTPVVTGETRGKGMIALFHVTADTSWSSLPLSGLFVDMMRTLVNLSAASVDATRTAATAANNATLAPLQTLDGDGRFRSPPATAKPVPANYGGHATGDYPPGFYGSADDPLAVNALRAGDKLVALEAAPFGISTTTIETVRPVDLRPWLIAAALIGLILDTLATLWLSGALSRLRRPTPAVAALLIAALLAAPDRDAAAQTPAPSAPASPPAASAPPQPLLSKRDIDSALVTRLAYVVTGDAVADETSRAGMAGLTQALGARTALEPGEPVGVNLDRDDLSVYPMLYWPIVAGRPAPIEAHIRKLDAFMKNGGTVIFDTRDALSGRPGAQTPENVILRRILGNLDIPELEPVPRDHVVTKAFYLIDRFPGRYDGGQTWIEALPPASDVAANNRPARAGDGVSPIIITGNDLAAAWAVNRRGEPLYPVTGSDPRQREMSLRGGINLMLYILTGNYKADQVHVPALLERLGQ